jgi:LmbE family N-acetylglucosaminyl deacetylase
MTKVVMVVAAHPDDEALGCAGTIAKHVAVGDTVHFIFAADGVSSRNQSTSTAVFEREAATNRAAGLLGVTSIEFLGFPDNRLDTVELLEIVRCLESRIACIKPNIIYTHHCGDLNVDHRQVHLAVLTACRPLPGSTVREIYAFEVLSSTEWSSAGDMPFLPNHYVDITDFLNKKMSVLEAYQFEMRPFPHSRSVEHVQALATHRGCSVGFAAAEAFMALRVLR